MPFPVVHLCIAKNILKSTNKIDNPCEFILGTLAPDSVHFRPNYNSDMKKVSHLCVGEEKWGLISNNKVWTENVFKFIEANNQSQDFDFILGYCTHILSDIRNNIKVWTPFRQEHEHELKSGGGSLYHKEAALIDYELFRTLNDSKELWKMIKKSKGVDIPGIVNKIEVEKMKHSILYEQYVDREPTDFSGNKLITFESTKEFIADESEYVKEQLVKAGLI